MFGKNPIKLFLPLLIFVMLINCDSTDSAPTETKGNLNYYTVNSSVLSQTMNYTVYLPPNYTHKSNSDKSYPVLFLLHGYGGNYRDWPNNGMKGVIDEKLESGEIEPLIIVMPDGLNTFYSNNYDQRGLAYEDFFVDEFIPHIEQKFRVAENRDNRGIAGLSMGGYGSLYHGLKYQDQYSFIYSMSGAVELNGPEPNLRELINSKSQAELDDLPVINLDCGLQDFLIQNNTSLSSFMDEKGIEHEFTTRPGSHNWSFWMESYTKVLRGFNTTINQ